MKLAIAVLLVAACVPLSAADPTTEVIWSAGKLKETEASARSKVDPALHRGVERLLDSATLIYRDGPSEAEAHTDRADFIVVREGSGTILIGGRILEGKSTGPGEIRGAAIDGGRKYIVNAGDSLYIPVNMAHQFLVEPGQHFVVMIVKVSPRD